MVQEELVQTAIMEILVVLTEYVQQKHGSLCQDGLLTLDKVEAAVFKQASFLMLNLQFTF